MAVKPQPDDPPVLTTEQRIEALEKSFQGLSVALESAERACEAGYSRLLRLEVKHDELEAKAPRIVVEQVAPVTRARTGGSAGVRHHE